MLNKREREKRGTREGGRKKRKEKKKERNIRRREEIHQNLTVAHF